jgi:hypothetical protein
MLTHELVRERIANEQRTAPSRVAAITDLHSVAPERAIRGCFRDVFARSAALPSNLPHGVDLRHYLLIGGRPIVDLYPDTSIQFQRRYRLSVPAVETLAKEGLLIPNLYKWRAPAEWQHAGDMEGLIVQSVVMGVRVDAFMTAIKRGYAKRVAERENELQSIVATATPFALKRAITAAQLEKADEFAPIVAKRWAYLDIIAPKAAEVSREMFTQFPLYQFALGLDILRHRHTSLITGAMGGALVFGPDRLRVGSGETSAISDRVRSLKTPEAIEYLITELMGCAKLTFTDAGEDALLKFLLNEENRELRCQLPARLDDLMAAALESNLRSAQVADFRKLTAEYGARLKAFGLVTGIAGSGISGALGAVFGGVLGGFAGGVAGFALGKKDDPLARFLASVGHLHMHRAFLYTQQLRHLRSR